PTYRYSGSVHRLMTKNTHARSKNKLNRYMKVMTKRQLDRTRKHKGIQYKTTSQTRSTQTLRTNEKDVSDSRGTMVQIQPVVRLRSHTNYVLLTLQEF
ncbi:MAG: hypothetical protein ABSD41_12495, partial [Candidatus Bathyarchaeia archaeon]